MTRHVLAVDLKDDPAVVEAYKAHHRRVWPEVLHSLRRVGIADMQIYLLGRRLVMVVDMAPGRDFTRAFAQHVASDPRVGEWEALMKSMQQPAPGSAAGGRTRRRAWCLARCADPRAGTTRGSFPGR